MNTFPYEDIIGLPHHKSLKHKPMPIQNRAAQFAPFAALSGYDASVNEASRLTTCKVELDEYIKEEINRKLLYIKEHPNTTKEYSITYFVPDFKKDGGKYVTHSGCVAKLNEYEGTLLLSDGTKIPITEIFDIEILRN